MEYIDYGDVDRTGNNQVWSDCIGSDLVALPKVIFDLI